MGTKKSEHNTGNRDRTANGNRNRKKYRVRKGRLATTAIVAVLLVAVSITGILFVSGFMSQARTNALKGKVIVVDAGHGGFDSGAIGVSGAREDELNLKVARYLKTALEANGARVIMTRSDENAIAATKDADMAKRRQIIEDSNSDIVVSIHMNSHTDPATSGPVVLFMPQSEQGKLLASAVQKGINDKLRPDPECKVRSEELYVLKSGNQPCILVECGYISNRAEEEKLKQGAYQEAVAESICDGVISYLGDNKP